MTAISYPLMRYLRDPVLLLLIGQLVSEFPERRIDHISPDSSVMCRIIIINFVSMKLMLRIVHNWDFHYPWHPMVHSGTKVTKAFDTQNYLKWLISAIWSFQCTLKHWSLFYTVFKFLNFILNLRKPVSTFS